MSPRLAGQRRVRSGEPLRSQPPPRLRRLVGAGGDSPPVLSPLTSVGDPQLTTAGGAGPPGDALHDRVGRVIRRRLDLSAVGDAESMTAAGAGSPGDALFEWAALAVHGRRKPGRAV